MRSQQQSVTGMQNGPELTPTDWDTDLDVHPPAKQTRKRRLGKGKVDLRVHVLKKISPDPASICRLMWRVQRTALRLCQLQEQVATAQKELAHVQTELLQICTELANEIK